MYYCAGHGLVLQRRVSDGRRPSALQRWSPTGTSLLSRTQTISDCCTPTRTRVTPSTVTSRVTFDRHCLSNNGVDSELIRLEIKSLTAFISIELIEWMNDLVVKKNNKKGIMMTSSACFGTSAESDVFPGKASGVTLTLMLATPWR